MRGASFVRVVHAVLVSLTALTVSLSRASDLVVRGTGGSGPADAGVSSRCSASNSCWGSSSGLIPSLSTGSAFRCPLQLQLRSASGWSVPAYVCLKPMLDWFDRFSPCWTDSFRTNRRTTNRVSIEITLVAIPRTDVGPVPLPDRHPSAVSNASLKWPSASRMLAVVGDVLSPNSVHLPWIPLWQGSRIDSESTPAQVSHRIKIHPTLRRSSRSRALPREFTFSAEERPPR